MPLALRLVAVVACCAALCPPPRRWSSRAAQRRATLEEDEVPLRLAAPGRVVAIGDVHGDVEALASTLEACGLVDGGRRWVGGDATLVQLGDVLDRGDREAECWALLADLSRAARAGGGQVVRLLGNHEVMNVCGIAANYVHPAARTAFGPDRDAAWAPGGALARELADECYAAVLVGDTCFVHAHLPADATPESLAALNAAARRWLRGEPCDPSYDGELCDLTTATANAFVSQHAPPRAGAEGLPFPLSPHADRDLSPVWGRALSAPADREPPRTRCADLGRTLAALGAARLVVGHTPQSHVNAACDRLVWRVDTGMSSHVAGGAREALEIPPRGDCRVLSAGGPAASDATPLEPPPACEGDSCDVYYGDEVATAALREFAIVDGAGARLETVGRGGYSDGFVSRDRKPDVLGRGRFGQVYRGVGDGGLEVAIKVVPILAATATERDRLAREARTLGRLRGCRGIPQLLWSGTQQVFGQPAEVVVMDLLGPTVDAYRVDGGGADALRDERNVPRLSPDATLRVGRDLVKALRSCADQGLVHNDVKPTNVLFGRGDAAADAFLADFGQATAVGDGATRDPAVRYGGGTPLFASLAAQEGRPTTPADDLESLWYTLAFLAHGALPWQWEAPPVAARIKRQMFADACSIASGAADCCIDEAECCVTAHCRDTVSHWLDGQLGEEDDVLQALWEVIIDIKADDGPVDYDACLAALGEES